MNTASRRTLHLIEQIVKPVPVGTNLGLLQLICALISGYFLPARGAVHTALALSGLEQGEIRRSWSALRYGVWSIEELLRRFHKEVNLEGSWKSHEYEGYRPVAVDMTAIWRPRLQGWSGKLFRQLIGKSFTGICFGLIARVGVVGEQRIPIVGAIVRGSRKDPRAETLKMKTLRRAAQLLEDEEVVLHDGGVSIAQVQTAQVARYLIRLSSNCTGRRNWVKPYKGVGVYPSRGELVRPVARTFKGRYHEATPADEKQSFDFEGRQVVASAWTNLMRADLKVSDDHECFTIWLFEDPQFKTNLMLGTNLPQEVAPRTLYDLYIDRWPVEQVPLVAKQLLGCQRQFVFHDVSCWRLGELAFLVANLLTWLAATSPAIPTGFWDRHPKKRLGGSVDIWQASIWQIYLWQYSEFVENGLLPTIYLRELPPTVASRAIL